MCRPPAAEAADRDTAVVVSRRSEQGWALLCNGVLLCDDTGKLLPEGRALPLLRPVPASVAS
ncbi:DUF5999 family protein [Streptomyces massasporeus]|uniref:DUF5999 family protein n=1 Tax=Streptomyces massasporeus TaxID=67324 RepID=UPI0036B44B88